MYLETERLILRQWQKTDFPEFAAMNADPLVMRHFPSLLSQTDSDEVAERISAAREKNGFGFWALERKDNGEFIGMTGLNRVRFSLGSLGISTPFVEIGWRLKASCHRKGYASEAARVALTFGFKELELPVIHAFTALHNQASRKVMEKIGMENTGANFFHPDIERDNPVAEHCLYKIRTVPVKGSTCKR